MRMPSSYSSSGVRPILVAAAVVLVAYIGGRKIADGQDFNAFLLGVLALCVLVLLNPRLGVYAFLFTLILVPFDWRIEGLKVTSPNAILVGAAVVSWALSLIMRSQRVRVSSLYVPFGIAVVVAFLNLVRYGAPFFNTPYTLAESALLFVLGFHLFRDRAHLVQLLVVLALALAVRNSIDLGLTIVSLNQGSTLGAIRADQLMQATASTTESEWRSLLLPLLLAGTLMVRNPGLRLALGVALVTNVMWLALAVTRTGVIGLAAVPLFLLLVLPGSKRGSLLAVAGIGAVVAVFFAGFYSDSWSLVVRSTVEDIDVGWAGGRLALWSDAFGGFVENPWWGSGLGPSHSFILGTARTMGIVFVIPFLAALWLAWRHGAWLRRQELDDISRAFVTGVQAGLLVATMFAFVGVFFRPAVDAFLFWLLIGVQEAIYLDVRSGRRAIARAPSPRIPGRRLEPPRLRRAGFPRARPAR